MIWKKALKLPHSIQQDTSDLCVYLVDVNWHPPACVLEETSYIRYNQRNVVSTLYIQSFLVSQKDHINH